MRNFLFACATLIVAALVLLLYRSGSQASFPDPSLEFEPTASSPGAGASGLRSGLASEPVPEESGESQGNASSSGRRDAVNPDAGSLFQGHVRSTEGQAVPGARIRWLALLPQDTHPNPAWPSPDWGILERPSVEVVSDERGRFAFAQKPDEELNSGSVLVAFHEHFVAGGLDLGAQTESWPENIVLALEPSESIAVEAVDGSGRPCAGATIRHAVRAPQRGFPGTVRRFERFLSQRVMADSAGRATLGPLPGTQVLWAEARGLMSSPWEGEYASRVVLTLGESFTIGGTLVFPDRAEWSADYVGERRILVAGERGGSWQPLARVRDIGEGAWGPVPVPLAGMERYSVRLEGAPIMPIEEEFEPPEASGHVHFDFVATKEAEIYFFVMDEAEAPITTARATVWWGSEAASRVGPHVEGASRPDGYLYVGTFPAGPIHYRVSAPGHVPFEGQTEVPSREAELIRLMKGGGIRGHCLAGREPVRDFEVIYWREGNAPLKRRQAFSGRDDGGFGLDDLLPGSWFVHAATVSEPPGTPLVVQVRPGRSAEVELTLVHPIRGAGRVVDASNGEPIAGARVQAFSSGGLERSFPWGQPATTGHDGTFELAAFVLGSNHVTVSAVDYADLMVTEVAGSEALLEWGDIALQRPQVLELKLLGTESWVGLRPEDVTVKATRGYPLPVQRFFPDGTVRYENVPPGDHQLILSEPSGAWTSIQLRLDPGKEWRFDHKVAGDRKLELLVLGADRKPLDFTAAVVAACQEETGCLVVRCRMGDEEGRLEFEGLRGERVQVSVYDSDGVNILAARELVFGDAPTLQAEIRVGEVPLRLRVLDREGSPLPGAWVLARAVSGSAIYGIANTNAEGWTSIFGVPAGQALVDVRHGIAGRRNGVLIDASVREQEFVLDASGAIELCLVDGTLPLVGVATRIETESGLSMSEVKHTDAQGVVGFSSLGEGHYRLSCRRADCWTAVTECELASDAQERREVQMRRLADLELSVLDAHGAPVRGVPVELRSIEFDADVHEWVLAERVTLPTGWTTDDSGIVRVRGLPRGAYAWLVAAEPPAGGVFELMAGSANAVVARLPE